MQHSNTGDSRGKGYQLDELVAIFANSWRLIAGTTIATLLLGLTYIVITPPIYQADVLLQIEKKSEGISALAELSELFREETQVSAEFEILRSRMVLGTVVDNLNLDLIARPVRFPLIGAAIARSKELKEQAAGSFFETKKYSWGSERIKVESFDVPDTYHGEVFTLVAGEKDSYQLIGPEGMLLAEGVVGQPVTASLADTGAARLFVSELKGKPGSHFELIRIAQITAINLLKESLTIAELGKQSGILRLSLEGPDRRMLINILNEIANIYLRQSVERKSAEAEKTLVFLDNQLPKIKEKMENAEAALNNYRLQKGSVDLSMETRATLDKLVSIDSQLTELRSEREELIRRFTPEHPRIAALDAQMADLNKELRSVDSKIKVLPGTQQDILRLTRDADVNRSLYTTLMNSAQELRIVKAGAVGNVRIVDYAVMPSEPVKPNGKLVTSLSFIIGLLLGSAVALIRRGYTRAVHDPDLIEKKFGIPVYVTVPYSRKQRELSKPGQGMAENPAVLAVIQSEDLAIESIRSLRTSLHFAQMGAKNNMISVTSPSPGAGKSFISVNLSAVLAGSNKRVLVIDADLRRGNLNRCFGLERGLGLSDIIASNLPIEKNIHEIIHKTEINNLDILTTGTIPPNPSELILHANFKSALDIVSAEYDHVVIDCPPVLAVTDASIIGHLVGATILVVKEGQSPLREIEQSIKRLKQANIVLSGVVYNGMKTSSGRYGYGKYYGYSYSYSHKKK